MINVVIVVLWICGIAMVIGCSWALSEMLNPPIYEEYEEI